MSHFTAVYDACVLYPAPLRDLLMRLAMTSLFRAKWTDMIHEEWMRNVLADRQDITREQLNRTRALMDQNVLDCLVTEFEALIPVVSLPDDDDRHVLAAAIRAGADVIVTFKLNDFPLEVVSRYGIDVQHPDEFINHLIDLAPDVVCGAAMHQRRALVNPPKSVDEFLETLELQGLPQTVKFLKKFSECL